MRFDMIELYTLGVEKRHQRTDLIEYAIGELSTRYRHLSSPKSLQVRQRRVGADRDTGFFSELDGPAHVIEIRPVKAARDIVDVNDAHQPLIRAELIDSKTLSHIAIKGHAGHLVCHR